MIYKLERKLEIPISLEKCWDFFSDPSNLKKITPDHMDFKIVHRSGDRMYAGQIISYKVKPVLKIPLSWTTEITHVEEPMYFVDEQRFGPYSFWHHQHHFEETKNGVLMTDIVHYKLPLGILGRMMNTIMVKKQLNDIFDYRTKAVEKEFGLIS